MLVIVKKPRIEIAISGEGTNELVEWITQKFDIQIVSCDSDTIKIENTDFYREMNSNRVGNLLEAARLKSGLTQKQLAEKIGIKQNMLSDYETGKRKLTKNMAGRIAKELKIKPERLDR